MWGLKLGPLVLLLVQLTRISAGFRIDNPDPFRDQRGLKWSSERLAGKNKFGADFNFVIPDEDAVRERIEAAFPRLTYNEGQVSAPTNPDGPDQSTEMPELETTTQAPIEYMECNTEKELDIGEFVNIRSPGYPEVTAPNATK